MIDVKAPAEKVAALGIVLSSDDTTSSRLQTSRMDRSADESVDLDALKQQLAAAYASSKKLQLEVCFELAGQ